MVISNLNGLRALAACIVLVSHAGNFGMIFNNKGNGQLGVMLFFVLSGFLMGWLYIIQRSKPFSFFEFWIKRFFRVAPLFLVVVIISYIFGLFKPGWLFPITNENVVSHLLFSDGVWVLWTIPVELKFYILFPFLAVPFLSIKNKKLSFLVFSGWLILSANLEGGNKFSLVKYAEFFMLGVWLAFLKDIVKFSVSTKLADVLFLLWVASFWIVSPAMGPTFKLWSSEPGHYLPYLIWAGSGVLIATYNGRIMNLIYSNAFSVWVGSLSYGIYLLHYPIMRRIARSPLPGYLEILLFCILILAIAWASFRFFETPLQRLGLKIIQKVREK